MTDPERQYAVEAFNRSWELLESQRSPDQDAEALAAAFASRWHWSRIGGPEQLAVGDHQVAKVASALGFAGLALHFARRAWDCGQEQGWTDWRRAVFAEGMARAHEAAGDTAARDEWLRTAASALASVEDAEDREVVERQLREIPGWAVVSAG
ncbi:MAG TPA: hypothetical protein VFM37_12450 [Pseudonocardiaceae bacterium]|nr:hypothetical protein [Pseudonocardiaceae bacterium]